MGRGTSCFSPLENAEAISNTQIFLEFLHMSQLHVGGCRIKQKVSTHLQIAIEYSGDYLGTGSYRMSLHSLPCFSM